MSHLPLDEALGGRRAVIARFSACLLVLLTPFQDTFAQYRQHVAMIGYIGMSSIDLPRSADEPAALQDDVIGAHRFLRPAFTPMSGLPSQGMHRWSDQGGAPGPHMAFISGIIQWRIAPWVFQGYRGYRSTHVLWTVPLLAVLAIALLFRRSRRALRPSDRLKGGSQAGKVDHERIAVGQCPADRLLRNVLDMSPVGIMSLQAVRDVKGVITDFEWTSSNAAANILLGCTDLVGKRLSEKMPGSAHDGSFNALVEVVQSSGSFQNELRYRSGGQDRWLFQHAVRLEDGIVLIISDHAEQHRAQRLRSEKERVELIERITRTVAHEVRNPLTNLHLALEQLQDEIGGRGVEVAMLLDVMDRNLKRIATVVNDLHGTTRDRTLDMGPCILEVVLRASLAKVEDGLAQRGMRSRLEVEPGLPSVQVDPELLALAITNILLNAMEAMEEGRGELVLRARMVDGQVTAEIADNGKGMDAGTRERLFEPFFSARPGGLGLGLTTAYAILNAHGVQMTVESEQGKGTTFLLRFQ